MSDCQATRERLLDAVRGRLTEPERARFSLHLQSCTACRALFEREQALERALAQRPRHALPEQLREKLAARVAQSASVTTSAPNALNAPRRSLTRLTAIIVPSLAAALMAAALLLGLSGSRQPLVDEAINDHLRVLYAQHPIEIESGGIHQVKPWFAGKLDFAPVLEFSGDEEFPLQGGAIALFVDRRAATFVFKHRLHTASLFVFQRQGLDWPRRATNPAKVIGSVSGISSAARGFNVLLWQDHDLGYALVSDMDASALARLAAKLAGR